MQTIQAMVNPRLLTKANRLFTGTLQGRIIEILQNARRAGATKVVINNQNGVVSVRDNGSGVEDFARLLDLGGSGWDELEASEDPAGVGLFCLAPRRVVIRSQGKLAVIDGDGWSGTPVDVQVDPSPRPGTILEFEDEPWKMDVVEPNAVFTGLDVIVDNKRCARLPFVSQQASHCLELGCRIEVCESDALSSWHRSSPRGRYSLDNVLINFHGQVVSFDWHPVSEHRLHYLVELTGEPTSIRLMLPARTRVVENGAFTQLKDALQLEAFRYLLRRGHHRLPYSEYLYARRRGIELPEATPTFQVGVLSSCDAPEPVEVSKPEDWPLAKCYRLDPDRDGGAESDEANIHLLAALGTFDAPFIPVSIRNVYDGYSWAKLPTVEKVTVSVGKELQSSYVWSGKLTCVDFLTITVHTSDGKVFSSPVCMAIAPPPNKDTRCLEEYVLVTPAAEQQLNSSEIWHHLGGWYDEGDTYDTQEYQFEQDLNHFWAKLRGPDENLRCRLLGATEGLGTDWKSVVIVRNGNVRIRYANKQVKTITRPKSTP
jgi:hypothetical protein